MRLALFFVRPPPPLNVSACLWPRRRWFILAELSSGGFVCVNELSGWGQRLFFPTLRGNSEGHGGFLDDGEIFDSGFGGIGRKRLRANVSRAVGSAEAPGRNEGGGRRSGRR